MEVVSEELGTVVSSLDLDPSVLDFFYSLDSQHNSFLSNKLEWLCLCVRRF